MDGRVSKYDIYILYNKANSPSSQTEDTKYSLEITKLLVEKVGEWGIKKCYYHERDAIPGRGIFSELKRLVESSKFTAVMLTKGFVRDCWSSYTQQSAFKKLLDKNCAHRLIPIAVGIEDHELPDNLDVSNVFYLENGGKNDSDWQQLKNVLEGLPRDTQEPEYEDQNTRAIVSHAPVVQSSDADSEDPYKRILDSLHYDLVLNMEGDLLVGLLRSNEYFHFHPITLRNIQEASTTTAKNEGILKMVKCNGKDAYIALKSCLTTSNQTNLLQKFEKKEIEELGFEEEIDSMLYTSFDTIDLSVERQLPVTGSTRPEFMGEMNKSNQHQGPLATPEHLYESLWGGDASNNTLREVVDLEGATSEISAQSRANMSAQYTTLYTRNVTQELVSLEMDRPPTIGQSISMKIESGPKLKLPPIKKVSAPKGMTEPLVQASGDSSQSTSEQARETAAHETELKKPMVKKQVETAPEQLTTKDDNQFTSEHARETAAHETELKKPMVKKQVETAPEQLTTKHDNQFTSEHARETAAHETELKKPVAKKQVETSPKQQTTKDDNQSTPEQAIETAAHETELKKPVAKKQVETSPKQLTTKDDNQSTSESIRDMTAHETESEQPVASQQPVKITAATGSAELIQQASIQQVTADTGFDSLHVEEQPMEANVTAEQHQPITGTETKQYHEEEPIIANVTTQQYQQPMSLSADTDLVFDNGGVNRSNSLIGKSGKVDEDLPRPGSVMSTEADSGYSCNSSPDTAPFGTALSPNTNSTENENMSSDTSEARKDGEKLESQDRKSEMQQRPKRFENSGWNFGSTLRTVSVELLNYYWQPELVHKTVCDKSLERSTDKDITSPPSPMGNVLLCYFLQNRKRQ